MLGGSLRPKRPQLRPIRIVTDEEEMPCANWVCAGLDSTDPEPRIDDPGSWRGAPTHRRAYQSWHAREQRRKKRPAPAAALDPAPTAPRRQSAASASSSTASAADDDGRVGTRLRRGVSLRDRLTEGNGGGACFLNASAAATPPPPTATAT